MPFFSPQPDPTPNPTSGRNRQAWSSLWIVVPLALGAFARSRQGSETKDSHELTAAMQQGGFAAVRNVETQSELGGKLKSIAGEMETSQQTYDAVTAQYDLGELTSDKSLGASAGIGKGLNGVSELERAATAHHEEMSHIVQEMDDLTDAPRNKTEVAKLRTTNDALFKDEKAIYDAARAFLQFAQAKRPALDSKHGTLRWLPSDRKRALDLETEFASRAMYYDQQVQKARLEEDETPDKS